MRVIETYTVEIDGDLTTVKFATKTVQYKTGYFRAMKFSKVIRKLKYGSLALNRNKMV